MRFWSSCLSAVALSVALSAAQSGPARTLDIYVVDVEGGNATLFVAPNRESVLIDSGNGGAAATRDADRIMAAAHAAGLSQIDHLITTHWHGDHFGGMAELASRIPVREFIDHGPNVQPAAAADDFLQKVYPTLYTERKTHDRQTRRSGGGHRPRLANRGGGRADDQDTAARRAASRTPIAPRSRRRTPTPPKTRSRSAASSRSAGSGLRISAI